MSKIHWKGSTLLAPLPPIMVSCGSPEKPNIITVAWTGITNTVPPKTYISVRPQRYSYEIIKQSRVFTMNLTPKNLIREADFCGMYTGAKVDKFQKCHLTAEAGIHVSCPSIAQCPVSIECRVTDIIPLGSHDMFLADIVTVSVDEALLDASGKLCLERAGLAAFAHGAYYELGKKIGKFGFSAVKKNKKRNVEKNQKNQKKG